MSTPTLDEPTATQDNYEEETIHFFHAEAHGLNGNLKRPIEQKIEKHVPVALSGRRATHLTRFVDDVNIEGLVRAKRAHTRVSGSRSLKHRGWTTLSTSVVEGLNVFEIITADRLVSQVSTDHPFHNGHFPRVTFLGTQFNNLRVSGFPVELEFDFGICGEQHDGDVSYHDTPEFLKAVQQQTAAIAGSEGLPGELKRDYDSRLETINLLIRRIGERNDFEQKPAIQCSLVKKIGPIPIPGVRSFGHILVIPEFGTVVLGEIEVGEKAHQEYPKRPDNYFELTNVRMNMGCVGDGVVAAATAAANGHSHP